MSLEKRPLLEKQPGMNNVKKGIKITIGEDKNTYHIINNRDQQSEQFDPKESEQAEEKEDLTYMDNKAASLSEKIADLKYDIKLEENTKQNKNITKPFQNYSKPLRYSYRPLEKNDASIFPPEAELVTVREEDGRYRVYQLDPNREKPPKGGFKRKSRKTNKYRKSRKSRKSRKTNKSRKSRKYRKK